MLVLAVALAWGCQQTAPSQPETAPSAAPEASVDPEAIHPDPERSWRTTVAPKPAPSEDWYEARKAPRFQIETIRNCPTCYGIGGTVVALTSSRKAAEQHAVALRSLMVWYKGSEWNRHLTVVPWFGEGKYALIFADTFEKQANQLCPWLHERGWQGYAGGSPGTRECKVYKSWPPAKP